MSKMKYKIKLILPWITIISTSLVFLFLSISFFNECWMVKVN
jgi:uncharacterized phage infection (PIP) family protein YhgE